MVVRLDLVDLDAAKEFGQNKSTIERFFRREAACQVVLLSVQKNRRCNREFNGYASKNGDG